MSKRPEEFRKLFTQINAKLASSDPGDVITVASLEFKQIVESLLHEFQTSSPNLVRDREPRPNDALEKAFHEYPMTSRFEAYGFDENAVRGAWQALGIASALPGPRQHQWEEQTDDIVARAPIVLLDLVTNAYSGALSDDQRKAMLATKSNASGDTISPDKTARKAADNDEGPAF